jgi:hypothetical protein
MEPNLRFSSKQPLAHKDSSSGLMYNGSNLAFPPAENTGLEFLKAAE